MTLFLDLSKEEFATANKIVRLAELQTVLLERSSTAVAKSFAEGGRKLPPSELKFMHRAVVASYSKQKLQLRVVFRVRGQESGQGGKPILALSATFFSEYSFPNEVTLSEEECRIFASANGIMVTWPYWRELVQSNIARMSLPPLTLPFMKLRQKPAEEPKDTVVLTTPDKDLK
ncbi:MAG TPA: hypothetical protein VNH19_17185 [Candidatus Limnocylindrales bacterium]|nr:hypothetical protein [Candidatus Limnocylindrales bacterium]